MTVEEAIKCIDDVLNSDYHHDESLGYQLTSDDFEWLEKSKEALEKQIPKKPIGRDLFELGTATGHTCPTCGYDFPIGIYKPYKHCPECGQKIDRGDA